MKVKDFEIDPRLSFSEAVKRAAQGQLDKASNQLQHQPDGRDAAVHEFRKSTKKLRALLRLVRGDLKSEYAKMNHALRDAARQFSEVRDHAALLTTCNALNEAASSSEAKRAIESVREQLSALVERADNRATFDEHVQQALHAMDFIRNELRSLEITGKSTLRSGLARTYSRALSRFKEVRAGKQERYHELRKRVKYHRYHLRLLRPSYREVLDAERKVAKKMSDLLGDDHDLQVLSERLGQFELAQQARRELEVLIEKRRHELQEKAMALGDKLLFESSKRRRKRLTHYLRATMKAKRR